MCMKSHIHEDEKSIIWYKGKDNIPEEDLDDPNDGLPEEDESEEIEDIIEDDEVEE